MIPIQAIVDIWNLWQSGGIHIGHEGFTILGFGVMALGILLYSLRERPKYTIRMRLF